MERRRESAGKLSRASHRARLLRLRLGIVFLVVDLIAHAVLPAVHLPLLLGSEFAAVCCSIVMNFLIELVLFVLQAARFLGVELARFQALRDAVLLIFAARVDLVVLGKHRGHQEAAGEHNLDDVGFHFLSPIRDSIPTSLITNATSES